MVAEEVKRTYTVVIGLEVHIQLLTASKIFSSERVHFGDQPNTNISVITLAHPGTLPRLNKRVAEYAIRLGLACKSQISRYSTFDRKNYYYPDLPKGYQLTQDRTPICKGGEIWIKTSTGERGIILNRIHMEEDAGKSIHLSGESDTLVDFNRAGTPLLEIVTEPVLRSAEEAIAFLTEIRRLVRYLEICDGNMEEGSMRCDVNISLMPRESTAFGKKVEVKNMNSFRHVKRAIEFEIARQATLLEQGKAIVSETRTFDVQNGTTAAMRTKEALNDYRYFPEPDLSPLVISDEWLAQLQQEMPILPGELHKRLLAVYGLSEYDALLLTENKATALYFEQVCRHTAKYKAAANWINGPVKTSLNTQSDKSSHVSLAPEVLAELIELVATGEVSYTAASQRIYPLLLQNAGMSPRAIAGQENLVQESDTQKLAPLIREVLEANPTKVAEYQKGKRGLIGMFMGEVMKKSGGKADPKVAIAMLQEALKK